MTKLLPLAGVFLAFLAAQKIDAQTLSVDQPSLTFTAEVAGSPTASALTVTSSTSTVIVATAVESTEPGIAWLSVNPAGGATPVSLAVTVNPANLTAGTYNGTIVLSTFTGSASLDVPVVLTVSNVIASPSSLSFQTTVGQVPVALSLTLSSAQSISFDAAATTTTGGSWLTVSPAFGIISGFQAISAIPNGTVVSALAAGTYNGSITITPTSGASTTPLAIPVTLTVSPAPVVTVSPSAVNLAYQIGGANNTTQETLTLTTTNSAGVPYTITATSNPNPSGGVWVTPNPIFGTITTSGTEIAVAYNTAANLPSGTYTSTVTVNTPTGSPTSTNVPVTLLVSSQPILNVPTAPLDFSYQLGSASPLAQTVNITTTGSTPQSFTVAVATGSGGSWLVAPATGATGSPLSVSVNTAGLVPGTYSGTVTVTGVGTANGATQIPVNLTVANNPAIVSNLRSLTLVYEIGQANAVSQAIALSSSNGVPLNFTATASTTSCGSTWLSLNGASGTTPAQLTAAVSPAGLTAGACTATISITALNPATGSAALASPLSIPVTLTVSGTSMLVVSPPTPAVFTALTGGSVPSGQNFTLTSSDSGILSYSVTTSTASGGTTWLQVSPSSGATIGGLNVISITTHPGQLAAGTYTGSVTIAASNTVGAAIANSPVTIPVTLQVVGAILQFSPASLSFQQSIGGPAPASQVIEVSSTGQSIAFLATAYTANGANWLTVTASGPTPATISVSANAAGLGLGTYTGTIAVLSTVPDTGNSPTLIPVTLVVNAGAISAVPASLSFTQAQGGQPPPAQNVTVSGTPGSIVFQASATASGGGSWLGISPGGTATPSYVQVYVAANSLAAGTYSGALKITALDAAGSPLTIPVTLTVAPVYSFAASPNPVTFQASSGASATQSSIVQLSSSGGAASWTQTFQGGSWLSATPSSGTTPSNISISANPASLAAGSYTGTVTITSPNLLSPLIITVNLVVGTVAPPALTAIANAASYGTGSVAPGENVVLFGSGIGPPQLTKGTVTNGVVDTSVAATRVLFNGIAAPVLYALSSQTSVMVPYELAGHSTASIVVEYQGVQSTPVVYTVAATEPGIYSQNSQGNGPGAILDQNYAVNLPTAPAAKGSVVSVYMTGEGDTSGAVDGAIATGELTPILPISATIGGVPATVLYAGTAPGIVTGATQVNIQVPTTIASGSAVPIVITVGTGSTAVNTQAGITIAVQ